MFLLSESLFSQFIRRRICLSSGSRVRVKLKHPDDPLATIRFGELFTEPRNTKLLILGFRERPSIDSSVLTHLFDNYQYKQPLRQSQPFIRVERFEHKADIETSFLGACHQFFVMRGFDLQKKEKQSRARV